MTSSDSSFEVIDVVKEDGPKYQERSYYPSQIPEDNTDRVGLAPQEQLSNPSQKPTECTSGMISGEVSIDAPKVGELADNLMVATRENEKLRTAMEGCNEALRKQVEAAENKQQEMENLKTKLDEYKVKIAELESTNKSLQDQLPGSSKWEQGASQLTGETDHSVHDVAASLREQLLESNTEKEQMKMMYNNLQQSQSSLQYEIEMLKQENQKLIEERKSQSDCFSSNEQLKSHISQMQQEMERLSLSQRDTSEAQVENRKLNFIIQSKDEEIDKLQKELFQQTQSEFQTLSSSVAERSKSNIRLMNKLEETNNEKNKIERERNDLKAELAAYKQSEDLYMKEKRKVQELQEELDKERRKHEETQNEVRRYSSSSEDLETKRKTLERMHCQLTDDFTNTTEELKSTKEMLRMKEQELLENAREKDELKENLETAKRNHQQLSEQLNATSRNLDQALDSLKSQRQQSDTISSQASEAQCQLEQEKEMLTRKLQDGIVERDKLMEQLREAYKEKEKIEQQFTDHVTASNETNEMLNQNIVALQEHEEELKREKDTMLAHIRQMDAQLKSADQQLNETIREYQTTVQDLETTVQRKKAIEGELHKLRGHYTQVNDERNQMKRLVDEKDKEIKDLVDHQSKIVQEHSDTMELMRNQIQQYARDYEDERTSRERFAQQMMKLQESVKQKDEEIDTLQGELTKYGGSRLRPAPDLNASMGGNSPFDRKSTMNRSGEKRRSNLSESEDQRNDQWTGGKKLGSVSSQESEDAFTTSYPPIARRNHPVTMSHVPQQGDPSSSGNSRMYGAYGNVPLNASGGGGAGISSGLPPPDRSLHDRPIHTDVHQLQQHPYNNSPGGGSLYRQDHNNQMNRSGEIRTSELGDYNARSELPPPHLQQPPMTANNFTNTSGGGGGDEGSAIGACPLCDKRFPTIEELSQHAALCGI